jgi:hypothetical protein
MKENWKIDFQKFNKVCDYVKSLARKMIMA